MFTIIYAILGVGSISELLQLAGAGVIFLVPASLFSAYKHFPVYQKSKRIVAALPLPEVWIYSHGK